MKKLYAHQQRLLDQNPHKHLLAWSCGLGKSLAAIELAKKSGEMETLVVCPKSLVEQWKQASHEHTHFFQIISKETFRRDAKTLRSYNSIIIDEADFFGNTKSQMHKSLAWYLKVHGVEYRYLLTATPYRSSIMGLFALGLLLGHNLKWYKWDKMFFNRILMGSRRIPVQKKIVCGRPIESYITSIIKKFGSSVKLDDCFDVPSQVFKTEFFKLTKEQKEAIANNTDVESIVRFTRKHQIEQGFIAGDKGYTEDVEIKCDKNDRIKHLCSQHKKVAIIARYLKQLKIYAELLKDRKIFIINGATKDKHQQTKDIDASDDCIVLIQSATTVGYELPSINFIIFASYDFSLAALVQARGRFLRANKLTHNVYVALVQKKGSIDYSVYDSLINKKLDYHFAVYKK